jgi:hypothetical protein
VVLAYVMVLSRNFLVGTDKIGARGSVGVEALGSKPKCHGFETPWSELFFSISICRVVVQAVSRRLPGFHCAPKKKEKRTLLFYSNFGGRTFLKKVAKLLPDYTVLQPRKSVSFLSSHHRKRLSFQTTGCFYLLLLLYSVTHETCHINLLKESTVTKSLIV